jgi:parallel beta-helix repeat protein
MSAYGRSATGGKKTFIIIAVLAAITLSVTAVSAQPGNNDNGVPFQALWDAIDELREEIPDLSGILGRLDALETTIDSFFDVFTEITVHEEDTKNLQNQINDLQTQLNELTSYCEECCEEPCEEGVECTVEGALGECANGLTTCEVGGPLCVSVNSPTDEICDGLDNDCDGDIDEGVVDVENGCGPCVDLDDETTWNGKIIEDWSGFSVRDDVLLCEKTYNFTGNDRISITNPSLDHILNCNNATIVGATTAPGTGSAISARYYNCGKFGSCHAFTKILNCNIENFNTGITVYMADDVTIENNNLTNVSAGIFLLGSHDSFVLNNTVTGAQEGIGVLLGQNYPQNFSRKPSRNLVSGNTIATSTQYGLHLTYGVDNVITGNEVSGSGLYGIYIYDGYNEQIYNNIFNNSVNAHTYSPSGFTSIWNVPKTAGVNIIGGPYMGGNYWSDYAGSDTDADGLGDTDIPYTSGGQIDEAGNGDNLPLVY